MIDSTYLDLAAAARSCAAAELTDALADPPTKLTAEGADVAVELGAELRVALLSNGIDLDDLEQATTVAATIRSIYAIRADAKVATFVAAVVACEAYEHGIRSAEVPS